LDRELLDVAALCGHLLGPGSVHAFLAEHRRRLFPAEMFEDLFPSGRGRPSVPADVIATVMVLQALEGLSDRQAVRRLETDLTWKAAAGLALADEAFHSTVLVLWRAKLRNSARPERIFDAVRQVMAASKVIEGKTRRALDSTVLDDAVARQDTIDVLVAQIRRVRKLIPELESVPVREHNLDGPGRPPCDWDDPADIDRVISELVDDANELVWAGEDLIEAGTVLSEKAADALALLALVAGQDVEPGERPGTWKIAARTARDRVLSTVDPESRHAHKTAHSYRDGFKSHGRSSPRRDWSPTAISDPASRRMPPPRPAYSTVTPTPRPCWATAPMAAANCEPISKTRARPRSSKLRRCRPRLTAVSASTTSTST